MPRTHLTERVTGSLRVKLTVAFLAASLTAILVVGASARWGTASRFDDLVVERAFEGFQAEIVAYYEAYGSWDAARAAEPFRDFAARLGRAGNGLARPAGPLGPPLPGRRPPLRQGSPFNMGGTAPPFVVTDRDGEVLLPLGGRAVGEVLDAGALSRARPIMASGTEIALAVAAERPVLTPLEERYLSAIEDAWVSSLLLAGALAVPLGLMLGSRISSPIKELTAAIARMRTGELRQSVRVRTHDELGQLSAAFNTMSEELATAYQELEESRARLGEQAEKMRDLSRRDELTGLRNRRAFDEQTSTLMAQAQRYGRPLTLALADVDHFKKVNDRFSHAVGDTVLREVGALLRSQVREADVVARYGGEEFAIAFPETEVDVASGLADRLRGFVADHTWGALAEGLSVTVSVGLAGVTPGESLGDTLARADAKLYQAKEEGRDRVRS